MTLSVCDLVLRDFYRSRFWESKAATSYSESMRFSSARCRFYLRICMCSEYFEHRKVPSAQLGCRRIGKPV